MTDEQLSQITGAIAALGTKFDAQFDTLSAKIDAVDAKVDAVDAKVEDLRQETHAGFAMLATEIAIVERYSLDASRALTKHANDPAQHHRHAA